jgi:hypothetical protein
MGAVNSADALRSFLLVVMMIAFSLSVIVVFIIIGVELYDRAAARHRARRWR